VSFFPVFPTPTVALFHFCPSYRIPPLAYGPSKTVLGSLTSLVQLAVVHAAGCRGERRRGWTWQSSEVKNCL